MRIRKADLPLVVSLHDYSLSCPTGLTYRTDGKEPCRVRPLSLPCLAAPCDPQTPLYKMIRVVRSLVMKGALGQRPFTTLHVSEIGRRTIELQLPPGVRQVVLENPASYRDQCIRTAGSPLRLAFCGRLTEEKGAEPFRRRRAPSGAHSRN